MSARSICVAIEVSRLNTEQLDGTSVLLCCVTCRPGSREGSVAIVRKGCNRGRCLGIAGSNEVHLGHEVGFYSPFKSTKLSEASATDYGYCPVPSVKAPSDWKLPLPWSANTVTLTECGLLAEGCLGDRIHRDESVCHLPVTSAA